MSAAASTGRRTGRPTRGAIAAQWFGVLGPLAAAYGQQQLSYMFVDAAWGGRAPVLMHLPPLVGLVITGAAATLAWRVWQRGVRDGSADDGVVIGSARFFAVVGLCLSGLAVGLILAQWLPTLFLHPCQR